MKRMQMNLGLAAAVVALAVAVYVGRDQPEPKKPLTPIAEDAVTDIVIAHPDKPEVKLHKQDGQWRIVAPVDAATDPFEVSSLVNLAGLDVEREIPVSELDLAELKLDPPQYRIRLNETELAFGDAEPITFRRYIRVGDHVALVADPPSAALDADYSDLVAKEVLPKGAKILRIEVPGLTVSRDGDAWVTEGTAAASSDQLAAFVDHWASARSMWNAARPADAGDDGQTIRVAVEGATIDLRLVETEPQLVIDRPALGIRYTLSKADADTLLRLTPPKAETDADTATGPEAADAPDAGTQGAP
ncbi:MAG: DUF4340 domain-containing protein [Nevskiales bacterium]|nr:DUF4340 domain-containing protein [Nevskiales bacterium]